MGMLPIRDRSGSVCGWLNDDRVHDLEGRTVAFIRNEQVVSSSGRHLGRLVSGFIRDEYGDAVAWLEGARGGPLLPIAGIRPVTPISDVRPISPITPIPPVKPIASLDWSRAPWASFVAG